MCEGSTRSGAHVNKNTDESNQVVLWQTFLSWVAVINSRLPGCGLGQVLAVNGYV